MKGSATRAASIRERFAVAARECAAMVRNLPKGERRVKYLQCMREKLKSRV
jgi:hypothetical protein